MRKQININGKWAFSRDAGCVPTTIDGQWDYVNLPHTWNAKDGQDGGNDYYRGTGYYAKRLHRSELPPADRYYLELRGANSSADVYLDGKHLAHHDGGYSIWRVELTEQLGQSSLLCIAVDNSPNQQVYPQMADFTFYGGLYRDANILCVPHSHFDLEHYGGPGLRVTPVMEDSAANVEAEVFLTDPKPNQSIRYTIFDKQGTVVAQLDSAQTKVSLRLENAHRWHGREDPYLYRLQAELLEDGQVTDAVCTNFGCRSFRMDPREGFILNGKSYPLRGVSRHQDRLGIGNALLPMHHKEDLQLICEAGFTAVRLAHYQHDPYFYDLCDLYGLVVWAEIPYISRHLPQGLENTLQQMLELIEQNYNHPSIVVWGLSNEISIGGSSPELLENHRQLNDLCHRLDKTRPTAVAAVSMCKTDDPYLQIPDLVAYNHYFGWYGGDTAMNGPWFDAFHTAYPHIPIACSEYGCEGLNWHSSTPEQGDYTEEYQAHYHEELIKQLYSRNYLWATYVWNMFDFGADARNEGGENGQNHKGLITFDRKYKKDAFYAYKAWLSTEPFVHICGKRYVNRIEPVTQVTVYSNLPQVELLANGSSLGVQEAADHFFRFQVPNTGTTRLEALAGSVRDEGLLRRVDVFDESYRLVEAGAVLNWFDVEAPEGRLCLNDKVSTVLQQPQGRQLFSALLEQQPGGAIPITEEMLTMVGSFTVLRLLSLTGAMADRPLSREELLALNAQLNQIPKDS